MFDSLGRVNVSENRLYFYEKDILQDNQIFSGDIIVHLNADYNNSGLGIVLFTDLVNHEQGYLIKVGTKEIKLIFFNGLINKTIVTNSVLIEPPFKNLNLTVQKINKRLLVTSQSSLVPLITYDLPNYIDKQSIGFYSNSGNYLNCCTIETQVPYYWDINMKNTKGGRISFAKNSFTLKDCIDPAEFQQQDVHLAAGTYYLHFNASKESDIKAYIMEQDDIRSDDDEKNLLNGNQFTLNKDTTILLKFKGKNGNISNIQISQSPINYYVATDKLSGTFNGSNIIVDILNAEKIELEFVLIEPDYHHESSYIISNGRESFKKESLNLEGNKLYKMIYEKTRNVFSVYDKDTLIYITSFTNFSYSLYLLNNVNAIVSSLFIHYKDHVVDGVTSSSSKLVPGQINSPIIVIDDSGEPLDLSSSFREITNDKYPYYIFTNYEREYFSSNKFTLSSLPKAGADSIVIFGVPGYADFKIDNLYKAYKENLRDISQCTSIYHLLDPSSYTVTDKEIFIDYVTSTQYKGFIVEYLKDNSYCVNFNYSSKEYEVDITEDRYRIIYEKMSKDNSLNTLQNFKYCDSTIAAKKYIVGREER